MELRLDSGLIWARERGGEAQKCGCGGAVVTGIVSRSRSLSTSSLEACDMRPVGLQVPLCSLDVSAIFRAFTESPRSREPAEWSWISGSIGYHSTLCTPLRRENNANTSAAIGHILLEIQ